MLTCRICKEEVTKYGNGKRCRICYNAYMAEYILKRYHSRRSAALRSLGGKCAGCSNTEDLEFDHIDPTTKTGDTGKLFTMGEARLQAELTKCQLLCKSCHLRKTIAMRSVEHGGGLTGKRNCRCDLCRPVKNAYMKEMRKQKKLVV